MTGAGAPRWDAGLQSERTTLAWVRSSLAFVGAGLLAAKHAGSVAASAAVLVLVLVVAGLMAVTAERRHHARAAAVDRPAPSAGARSEIVLTAVATVALAVFGLALVVG